ncbi:RHS repeat domain-containing protein [Paenibacillus sp. 481]|uniref:RHS repeat domain-containing protein n=1 Tax=Paenibacillus sp. 481 TaxID=2835869 RepID=UPI001E4CAFDD|nr:RHS repeat domain-containing protein [Paenibacillus sp. 481]UHA74909.1 RHS repeat protein [Paenibacillus sp. 481]
MKKFRIGWLCFLLLGCVDMNAHTALAASTSVQKVDTNIVELQLNVKDQVYAYDETGKLVSLLLKDGSRIIFTYDPNGNLLKKEKVKPASASSVSSSAALEIRSEDVQSPTTVQTLNDVSQNENEKNIGSSIK